MLPCRIEQASVAAGDDQRRAKQSHGQTAGTRRAKNQPPIFPTLGNAYTTNTRVLAYTFARVDQKTRVVVSNGVRAVFPNGRVNTVQLNDNNDLANKYQLMLEQAKRTLEGAPVQASANSNPGPNGRPGAVSERL